MRTQKSFLLLLLLCFAGSLYGYNIRHISNRDGLSNSAILSIYQDSEGLMWFGSVDGLNVFDGINLSVFQSADPQRGLSGNLIESIVETEPEILWLQTNYGLNRLDLRERNAEYFSYFTGTVWLNKDTANTLFILRDDHKIHYYDEPVGGIEEIELPGLIFADVADWMIDEKNRLWFFKYDGTIRGYLIDRNNQNKIALEPYMQFEHTVSILHSSHGQDTFFFIDSQNILYEYNLETGIKNYIFDLSDVIRKNGDVSTVLKYYNDFFIGFKTNGLLTLRNTPEREAKYYIEDLNIKSGVFSLYKDQEQDIVWIGTDGQGVFLYYDDQYTIKSYTFNNIPFPIEKPVRALFLDKENTLWVGTKGDGVLRVKNYDSISDNLKLTAEHITAANSRLSDNSVYAFEKSSRNILWIGHDEGLDYYSYKENRIKNISFGSHKADVRYIHSICEYNDTTLWLASVGMGMIRATIGGTKDEPLVTRVERFTVGDGRPAINHFFAIHVDQEKNIWFGNRGYGLCSLPADNAALHVIKFDKAYNSQLLNDIFAITTDDSGNLWCGTSLGLVKYSRENEITVFNEQSGFPNNTVHAILKDTQGNLWLSTNKGIIKFNIQKETFQAYNEYNGLSIVEYSDGAFFGDKLSNRMFFGGIDGFVSISETRYTPKVYEPSIYFNKLTIFGHEYNIYDFFTKEGDENILQLNHSQNFFTISFFAIDFVNANNYSFYYKLSGLSEQWIDNNGSRDISFTNVLPGTYTLLIKYRNRITGKESAVHSIQLNILPPWYASNLAYVIYFILALSVLTLIAFFLIRRGKKKRQRALEKIRQKHQEEVHESKLRFFTNIAHEFCTPLTLIAAPCNRILSHSGSDDFVKQYASVIQRNAERLNDLIQELIEFRRIETGHRKPVVEQLLISELLPDIVNPFREAFKTKEIEFTADIQSSLLWSSDKNFLYTVINNLISNALKYTNNGGKIKLAAYIDSNKLYISIANTGKGIRKEDYKRIFDRYSVLDTFENKEDSSISRNGLGLAISKNIIRLLNGTIKIESELNKETTFTVELPHLEVSDDVHRMYDIPEISLRKEYTVQEQLPQYGYDKNKQTILIIDDDMEILWLICEVFKSEFNVIPVNQITEKEDVIKDIQPDIIISDVMMPGVDGISLVKYFKSDKKTAHIPVILISAKHSMEEQIEGLNAGAEMYITKPFNVDYLKVSVQRLIVRKETLKDYFTSPISAMDLVDGKLIHKEDKQFLQQIIDIINDNLTNEELSAAYIAKQLHISVRHLYRRMSDISEKSITDMIKEYRLYVAQNLLVTTQMTIDEIIFNAGFNTRTTFYKLFSEKYNCTPKEYRESLNK